jgi:hypothetical protein
VAGLGPWPLHAVWGPRHCLGTLPPATRLSDCAEGWAVPPCSSHMPMLTVSRETPATSVTALTPHIPERVLRLPARAAEALVQRGRKGAEDLCYEVELR